MRRKTQKAGDELPNFESNADMNLSLVPYWFLAFLRVVITLLPQNGYIHPDEYFQSVEIVAGVSSR
jgi:phosphatidylinositol glycan class Z